MTGVGVDGMVTGVAVGCGVEVAMAAMAVAILASVVASTSSGDGPQATSAISNMAIDDRTRHIDILCFTRHLLSLQE